MSQPVIAVLNGPNLNLLGEREPQVYGHDTLADAESLAAKAAADAGYVLDFRQTNHEGVLVDAIQEVRTSAAGVVINAAALTHTSVAVHDALATVAGPVVEVHLSNIHRRERWRRHSYVSDVADAVIVGCGIQGYAFAVQRIARLVGEASHGS